MGRDAWTARIVPEAVVFGNRTRNRLSRWPVNSPRSKRRVFVRRGSHSHRSAQAGSTELARKAGM